MTLGDYLPVLVMLILAGLFAGVSLGLSRLLMPRRPTPEKLEPYECGIVPEQEASERFPVRFYMVAMMFIVFDVEIIFLYPWAVLFRQLRIFGLIEMAVFVALILVAYAYLWREGVLDWAPRRRHLAEEVRERQEAA